MIIEHIALWTKDLERLKEYYTKYFGATCNKKYVNTTTDFQSYFLTFDGSARLEIMTKPGIPENQNDFVDSQHMGLTHIAFGVETEKEVNEMAGRLENDGFRILRGPRISGDGYYEFETPDPDGNRLEVITKLPV